MIDWTQGYSAEWRVMRVDPITWADSSEIVGIASVSVESTNEDLMQTGSADVTFPLGESIDECWCRVEMLARQGAAIERVAMATLLMAPNSAERSHGRQATSLEGRSVLAPASDERLLAGTYCPARTDAAQRVAEFLKGPAPIVVEGAFSLTEHMVFAAGTTKLEAAWMLLDAAGWTLIIDGDGTIHITEKPTEPVLDLGIANASLLGTSVTTESDMWSVPNRYVAVDGDDVAIATNEDPGDQTSYVVRGRWVDEWDESPTPVDGETLHAYAVRRLDEMRPTEKRTYVREWWPGVTVGKVVRGGLASVGLVGDMRVTSQSLTCGAGVTISETAEVLR